MSEATNENEMFSHSHPYRLTAVSTYTFSISCSLALSNSFATSYNSAGVDICSRAYSMTMVLTSDASDAGQD